MLVHPDAAAPAYPIVYPVDVLRQPDGKLLVIGSVTTALDGGGARSDFAVARHLPGGALDPTFGTDGVATFAPGPYQNTPRAALLASDGTLYVAGRAWDEPYTSEAGKRTLVVLHVSANGQLDTSFGQGGFALPPVTNVITEPQAMAYDACRGRLLVAGAYLDGSLVYPAVFAFWP